MITLTRLLLVATVALLARTGHGAGNCEVLRAQIDAKIRRSGATDYTLVVVDDGAQAAGKVVGRCGQGTREIVYLRGTALAASAPAGSASRPALRREPQDDEAILTECRDGSVTLGGDCPPAAR